MDPKFVMYFVVPAVLIVCIAGLGLVFLMISFRRKQKSGQIEIRDWATTGGKVLSVRLDDHHAGQIQAKDKPAVDDFEPHVEYAYVVNNVEYRGIKVFPGESAGFTQKAAQEILGKYPLNAYVPVRYNPQDPTDSALEARSRRTDFLTMAGWVLTGFGVVSCCYTSFMAFIILGAIR
jgi:hypothetical protein